MAITTISATKTTRVMMTANAFQSELQISLLVLRRGFMAANN